MKIRIEPIIAVLVLVFGMLGSMLQASQKRHTANYWSWLEAQEADYCDIEKELAGGTLAPGQFPRARELCLLWRRLDKSQKAGELYRYMWSHQSAEKTFSGDALELADLYNDTGYYSGALDIYQRQLAYDLTYHPRDNKKLVRDYNSLGICYNLLAKTTDDEKLSAICQGDALKSFAGAKTLLAREKEAGMANSLLVKTVEENLALVH